MLMVIKYQAITACTTSTATKAGKIRDTTRTRLTGSTTRMETTIIRIIQATDLATTQEIAATVTRNTMPTTRR